MFGRSASGSPTTRRGRSVERSRLLSADMDAVFIDIDGTINVADCASGFTLHTRAVGYPIHAIAEVVEWLCGLHSRGVALVWNSTWNDRCEDYAQWFGLPSGLPWIRHDENRVSFGHSLKLRGALRYLQEHPRIGRAVVLDDVIGERDRYLPAVASGRVLVPELHDSCGVTPAVVAAVDAHLQPGVRV